MTDLQQAKLDLYRTFNRVLDALDEAQAAEEANATPDEVPTEPEALFDSDDKAIGYIAPDNNAPGVLKALSQRLTRGLKPGQTVLKGVNDKRLMLIVTSNSYEDRETETITTPALKADVDRHWTPDGAYMSNNKLLYWHDDDIELGDIVWGDVVGPFYVELAQEGDSVVSKRYFDYREAHADERWGASHRFAYLTSDRNADGEYGRIFKQETTTLPLDAAANLITLSGVLPMSDKKATKFDEIIGLAGGHDILKTRGLDALVEALQAHGIDHKSIDTPAEEQPETTNKFAELIVGMADDLASLAADIDAVKAQQETQEKAHSDQQSELTDAIAAFKAVAEKLQAQLDAKPRIASRSAETETTDTALNEDVANLMLVDDPVFGKVQPAQS